MKPYTLILITLLLIGCNTQATPEGELTSMYKSFSIQGDNRTGVFTYFLINYGYGNSTSVEVTCVLQDPRNNLSIRAKQVTTYIKPLSFQLKELSIPNLYFTTGLSTGCFITGCVNCEILDARIPEYIMYIHNI